MSRIIIFGNKSFIQKNLYKFLKKKKKLVLRKKFSELKKIKFIDNDIIINCSVSKSFFKKKYSKKNDRNLSIVRYLKRQNIRFLLLSSRMVYQPNLKITEKSTIKPINIYARNCLFSEKNCKKILGKKLCIIRISNVIGYEVRKNRQSLMSMLIMGVKKKKIILDENYKFTKDIIPINLLCEYIYRIIKIKNIEIINIGSGIGFNLLKIAEILSNLKVKILIKEKKKISLDNSYQFDIKKLYSLTNLKFTRKRIVYEIIKIKKKI